MHFSTLLAIVRVALLKSSWRSCFMRAALFIMRATNSSLVFTFSLQTLLFIHPHRQKSDLYAPTSNSCFFTPIENWTHVYMNLFTRNSPYYHLLKHLLFLLKHPVYMFFHDCPLNNQCSLTKAPSPYRLLTALSICQEYINPLNPELNPICYLLALLAHHFLHVSRIMVKSLTLRLLMSYIYMTLVA